MLPHLERKAFVCCLIDLAALAFTRELHEDAAALVTGLRILRPKMEEIDLIEAYLLTRRKQQREAVRLLRSIEDHATVGLYAKALLASCMRILDESGWEAVAEGVLAVDAPEGARELARAVLSKTGKVEAIDSPGNPPALSFDPAAYMLVRA